MAPRGFAFSTAEPLGAAPSGVLAALSVGHQIRSLSRSARDYRANSGSLCAKFVSLELVMARNNAGGNRRGARRGGRRRNGQMGAQEYARAPNLLMLKPSYTTPYKFSRSFDLGLLTKAAADQGYAWPFALNQLPASNEFTSLFDKYRIKSIDATFTYWRQGDLGGSTLWPTMFLYMDDDDAIIPVSKTEALQRMSVQRVTFSPTRQSITVRINPRFIQSRGGVSTNLAPQNAWIDMATPAVQHYGVKAWIDYFNNSTGGMEISMTGVMHFECNNVR